VSDSDSFVEPVLETWERYADAATWYLDPAEPLRALL